MNLIIQPRDGIEPFLREIRDAKQSIEIIIYRMDRLEIEQALVSAALRGVKVHALITYTNREDFKEIKRLEKRLSQHGINITRTAEDLVRYHAKMMIIDRARVLLLTFNLTFLDIHHSRSFGLITKMPHLVDEAINLFEADTRGKGHKARFEHFVVSPINSRERITEFILGAQKQLLIYDDKLTDAAIIGYLGNQARAGIDIRVIGHLDKRIKGIKVKKMPQIKLHAQAIIRDGKDVFFGSQSLRKVELDERREVGLITSDPEAVKGFSLIYELDWGDIID